mgnify:CR=1 FL=1
MRNYYEILGVPQDATLEQIEAAYRQRLADNPGDSKVLEEAHTALTDPAIRAVHDRFLERVNQGVLPMMQAQAQETARLGAFMHKFAVKDATMKAAAYVRTSTSEAPISWQVDSIADYARRKGIEVLAVYCDEGKTSADHRPGFEALMEDLENTLDVKAVIVNGLDRISRDLITLARFKQVLKRRGAFLIDINQKLSDMAGSLAPFVKHPILDDERFEEIVAQHYRERHNRIERENKKPDR